jgi:hypothetical protein
MNLVDGVARGCIIAWRPVPWTFVRQPSINGCSEEVTPECRAIIVIAREDYGRGTDGRRQSVDALPEKAVGDWVAGVGEIAREQDPLRTARRRRDEVDGSVEVRQRVDEAPEMCARDEMQIGELEQQVSAHVAA